MDVASVNSYRKMMHAEQSEQLILDHLHYVRHVLGRIVGELPDNVDVENLESAGVLGLVEAAAHYDPSRQVEFTTFAYPRIYGAIIDELRRNCPLPRSTLKQWKLIRAAYSRLDAPVTPESLATATGLSIDEVLMCLQAIRLTNPESWHHELEGGDQPATETTVQETAVEHAEEMQLLADSIETLPTQERTVLTLYYLEDLRLKEIGEVLSLSESRISRVLTAAELRLKETIRRRVDPGDPLLHQKKRHHHGELSSNRIDSSIELHSASRHGDDAERPRPYRRVRP